jgi:hypothetical protein
MAFKSNDYFYNNDGNDVIIALGKRISEPEIYHVCSPKEACRILSAFTALCCDTTTTTGGAIAIEQPSAGITSTQLRQQSCSALLSNVFQCLGECLIESSNLSPRDASSAIYAYAKAQYMFDMGIFDHIVNIFVNHVDKNPSLCTLRQICQTLWACGKMVSFETSNDDMDDVEIHATVKDHPPYYEGFVVMVLHVVHNADALSVQDVTQTFWAMARFDLFAIDSDVDVNIEPLLHQVQTLSSIFNAQERATLLWSFSKVPVMSPMLARAIFLLTRPFARPFLSEHQLVIDHPQVASIILYSLGRMNIRDRDVFHHLTDFVLEYQIKSANAQTIANILWAHSTVHIEPPQQLLERWTMLKLPDLNIANVAKSNKWPYYCCD